ncbi:hypothetical protein DUI87_20289 [Hirundo rustica rustica]|uniref:Uncharacterized protein n=1 Tax=Hirundo rustica rustica TaxID=333673 RepID=A0A3M0JQ43_HIRRU|nr:hypothetical protein DUI87_20289 [Hirundo rustica rustica]
MPDPQATQWSRADPTATGLPLPSLSSTEREQRNGSEQRNGPKGLKHPDYQNFTIPWMCHIHGYDQENHNVKFDLTVEAEINIYLFQNDKAHLLYHYQVEHHRSGQVKTWPIVVEYGNCDKLKLKPWPIVVDWH